MPEFLIPVVEWLSPLWESPSSFFNFDFLPKYWFYFRQGIIYTLLLSVVSVILAVIPALVLALMRLSKNKFLRGLSGAYIAVFRSTPLMVQLSIVYFGLFSAIQIPNVTLFGFLKLSMFIPCVTALALNSSAYVAEIFRAGILAVDAGQTEAARSLGLSAGQTMTRLILPQAFKNVLPALGNELIVLLKETSVAGYIALQDLTKGGDIIRSQTYDAFLPLIAVALIYLAVVMLLTYLLGRLERRLKTNE